MNGKTDKITLGHYPTISWANAKKGLWNSAAYAEKNIAPKRLFSKKKLTP
jgi:hypothetical protein